MAYVFHFAHLNFLCLDRSVGLAIIRIMSDFRLLFVLRAAILGMHLVAMVRTVHCGLVRGLFSIFFLSSPGHQGNFRVLFTCKFVDIDFSRPYALNNFFFYFLDIWLFITSFDFDLVRCNDFHFIFVDFLRLLLSRFGLLLIRIVVTQIFIADVVVAMTMVAEAGTLIVLIAP